jgi:OOP family OmpA-OmpF porin
MKFEAASAVCLAAVVLAGSSCATKKYVRAHVNERVTPLENRAGELEETSRRNTQEISRLSRDIQEVKASVDRAQEQADRAASSAEQANTRVTTVEQTVTDLRSNLDKYSLRKTVTVRFEVAKADLLPDAMSALDELAGQIQDKNGFILEIEGFASSEGKLDLNERLSQARSDAVRRYLADKHNIPVFRMYILGFGTSRPVADNTSLDGRKQNRRVEVRLLTSQLIDRPGR